MNPNLSAIRSAAALWRETHPDHSAHGHVIVIKESTGHSATGWSTDPLAGDHEPGAYIVNAAGGVAVATGGDVRNGATRWAILDLSAPSARSLTGGQISAESIAEYRALRARIKAEPDVYDVLELSSRCDGKWLYLIQTPLDWVFPKYVIGLTDVENTAPQILFKCGSEWSARAAWHEHRHVGNGNDCSPQP